MTEYVATNIAELTAAFVAITKGFGDSKPWWRGHVDAKWHLVPSLYRQGLASSEGNLNGRFRLMAGPRHHECPGPDEVHVEENSPSGEAKYGNHGECSLRADLNDERV